MSASDALTTYRRPTSTDESVRSSSSAIDRSRSRLVLIVDDEEPIAEALAMVVTEAGYEAQVACHGREAIEQARAAWPALVITDMMMPYLDGAGLISALRNEAARERRRLVPIIVMTAANLDSMRGNGADAILRKPFDIAEVERLLRRFLPQR